MEVLSQPQQIVCETPSRKNHPKKGLVEWLKVKTLSSSPSATKHSRKMSHGEAAGTARSVPPIGDDLWKLCGF
jgi:hypothetical protein